jgi:hypothetical protein
MNQIFILLGVLVFATVELSSQELPEASNSITAISVTGLQRTKPQVIEKPLQKFIGRDAGTLDINEVYAVVQSSGVLEARSVDILDNPGGSGKLLSVTVREKWSILPIPFGGINSSGWSVGGVVMDTNAFGIKDTMMLMGLFGSGDITTSLMYLHSPNGAGEFGWNVMVFFSLQENEGTDQSGKNILRFYNSMSIRPSAGMSYQITELVTSGFGLTYENIRLRDTEHPLNAPEKGIQGITFSPSLNIRHNTWDGYFLNEKQASVKYEYTLVIGGKDVHSVELNAGFNHSFLPGFRFVGKSGGVFSTASASPFFESPPLRARVNILPTSYSAVRMAGISAGLEKSLFKFSFGTISISAAYQAVYSHSDLLTHQFDHGPVAMVQMYFNRIAIPGVGLGGAYNVAKNVWLYAFSMGVQL